MCGIAGIFRRDGSRSSTSDVVSMLDAMAHRGPDGHGVFDGGAVVLGHRRLAVRDLGPAAAQPMPAPGGEGVLVYNGEIYGEGPLRAELEREGAVFRGTGDAEVVLHACARWGPEAAAARVDGMFAFAWWDARERALWLVRDRFGIKPLLVAVEDGRAAFASEARGLRALPGVGARPDLLELARRILPWRTDLRRAPFEGIDVVPPGGAWRIDARGVVRGRWCDLVAEVDPGRIVAAEEEDEGAWIGRAAGALERAVASHVVSDVPVAAFASSGVDSNLVAALARRHVPSLVAYTVDTVHRESEAEAAQRICAHAGIPVRTVRVDRETHLRLWPESVEALEFPSGHPSQPEMLALCRAARADGVVVVLTGEGADELFGGYDFFQKTWARWRRAHAWWRRPLRASAKERSALAAAPFHYQMTRRCLEAHGRVGVVLTPDEDTRARDLLARLAPVRRPEDRAFLAHGLDSVRRHLDAILLRHDRIGMAASLELRVPFLCREVADVGLHLPRRAKLRGRVGKWALRRAAARWIAPEAVRGAKRGFPVPDGHHRGAAAILGEGATVPDLFRWSRRAREEMVPRIEADPILRHQMVSLELWARVFLRGERPADLGERLVAIAG
jgi:asparagine synthase (glutamine-hydrolysing)